MSQSGKSLVLTKDMGGSESCGESENPSRYTLSFSVNHGVGVDPKTERQ